MEIKFKKLHENAVLPSYAKEGDAGLDLTAVEVIEDDWNFLWFDTGISVEIPEGYVGLIFPRSNLTKFYNIRLGNSVGVIDSGYRGSIQVRFTKSNYLPLTDYEVGDRIAQLVIMPIPKIKPVWAEELSKTERGEGGFGSSDTTQQKIGPGLTQQLDEYSDKYKQDQKEIQEYLDNYDEYDPMDSGIF